MAKLKKKPRQMQARANTMGINDSLYHAEKAFVLANYHEAATNKISVAGVFFTPLSLVFECANYCRYSYVKRPIKILDLCAGIGVLSWAINKGFETSHVNESCDITRAEINRDYILGAKKILPSAIWLHVEVSDIDALSILGQFYLVISNPAFGNIPTDKNKQTLAYAGSNGARARFIF